ncbi:MAG: MlaD family protein, partial [Rickettsiaceae bacterium]|nr:MlaD family protein [Rickettsiaceae bacterium]
MKQGIIETLVGLFVLIVAFSFLGFAYNISDFSKTNNGYTVTANFQNIDGIAKGADVKLAGIKIGSVDSLSLEDNTYYAILSLSINEGVNIPKD